MSDEIAAAPAAAEAPASPAQAPEAAAPAPVAEKTPEQGQDFLDSSRLNEQLEAIYDKHNRERGPDGRFAGKAPPAQNTDQPQQAVQEPAQPAIDAPTSWSADMKAKWSTLPPDARQYIAQRESEAHQAITRMGSELSQYRPLGELYQTHRATFDRHGADFRTGIASLLEVQQRLDSDPTGTIAAIAEMYGVTEDLRQMFGGHQARQQAPVDPIVAGLQRELASVKQSLQQRENAEQVAAARQMAELQAKTAEQVETWGKDKPHFAEVRPTMARLVAAGEASTLDQAYDKAIYAVPEVRAKVLAEAAKAAEAKRLEENRRQVSEAKRTAPLLAGRGRGTPAAGTGKWDDDDRLGAIYDRVAAG